MLPFERLGLLISASMLGEKFEGQRDSADIPMTAGSLSLYAYVPFADAQIAKKRLAQ
jgi:hypothetical protein